jgi:TRAP-type C4-dicarboxylate transport system substrate-binding protein
MNEQTINSAMPTNGMSRRRFLALSAMAAAVTACGVPESGGTSGTVKAATYIPPSYDDLFPAMNMLIDTAKQESGGDLAFQMFHSETLLDAEQLVPGLLQGVAQLVFTTSSYVSSTYPVLGAVELPFNNDGVEQTLRALEVEGPLYDLFNEELGKKQLHLVSSMPTSVEWIWTMDKPIRKPADMEGLRIRTAGEVEGETVKSLGGSPVSMSSSEVYQALQRGTIDGMISYMGTVISRDLQQVLRYGTMGHFGEYALDAYARKDWYDGLDSKQQDALLAAAKVYQDDGTAHQLKVHEEDYLPAIEKAGIELIEPSTADLKAFEKATGRVQDWWRTQVGDPALAGRALELVRTA